MSAPARPRRPARHDSAKLDLQALLQDDPETAARVAGLHYTSDDEPGYTRRRAGRGFSYRDPKGRTVRDRRLRRRFQALAIPPAWTDVWICSDRRGHIQATGRDDAERKQYIYHPRWREVRDRGKFRRLFAFGTLLPRIRARVDADLESDALSREKVMAAVVRLIETSHARVGHPGYARDNGSYGITTIRKRHVARNGTDDELVLDFVGKGGKPWRVEIEEPRVAEVVLACLETPGHQLFKYFDDDGHKRAVTADDVNDYLREIAHAAVTAKDFRTWAGTVSAAVALREIERAEEDQRPERKIAAAVRTVAEELGNTPAVCRQAYIHPDLLDGFENGELIRKLESRLARARRVGRNGLSAEERAVLAYLEEHVGPAAARGA